MLRTAFYIAALSMMASTARAAIYTDAASFLSAIGAQAPVTVAILPSYSFSITDAYGTYGPGVGHFPESGGLGAPGSINATFECLPNDNPCRGSYRETITLPYQITGLAGQLNYDDQTIPYGPTSLFGLPVTAFTPPFVDNTAQSYASYVGFYAQTFAPTNTLTFTWQPGLSSTDSFAGFSLNSATVLVPAPEPESLALLAAPLLMIGGLRHRA